VTYHVILDKSAVASKETGDESGIHGLKPTANQLGRREDPSPIRFLDKILATNEISGIAGR
jgi:hypothetical protein